ncbi:Helix-turn-helix domain-containing protein [Tissierella praeacuta DSM 18095]|uniref:Helix-turn-helix domain-containing protein n=1 Tax=Tissierella praeacuta DSM 18095 TaxID=1123404 RepID=A0A1M4WSL3_9FIRM|nr:MULTISPECIES: helix-turn-helix transcriptional regulator [Tissierella]TCU75828.1 helix-turn-helix protein [Tissierella praeacuta]SHE84205.1 Helix-turn-helix domain-containing protein [Tissierella praeacuta DSM 18095]SUP00511.1 HTH-type transcriptional regulator immR [Tissierella praeacuta]
MSISNRIKTLREEKDINQRDFADMIQINNSVLSRIESGERPVRDDEIVRIAEALGVSTDYLLGRTDIKNPEDKIKNLDKLAHKEINSVEDALEIIESQEGLMLKGEMLTDEDKLLLANALQLGMKYVLDKKQKEKK